MSDAHKLQILTTIGTYDKENNYSNSVPIKSIEGYISIIIYQQMYRSSNNLNLYVPGVIILGMKFRRILSK